MNNGNLMLRIANRSNLHSAWERVFQNKGSPGIDHVSCQDFKENLNEELLGIESDLLSSLYCPATINTVPILKDSGKKRIIGIMTVRDRVCAYAVARVLKTLIEPTLQPCSYAYRPGRSATDAANYVEKLIIRGMSWVLETDVQSYFDTINHDILLSQLSCFTTDTLVMDLVKKFLTAPETGAIKSNKNLIGIAQGSPLSPLLANLYLNDVDKVMLDCGFRYIRYADDLIVLSHTIDELQNALSTLESELAILKLQLSEPKTRITEVSHGFVFLGFKFDEQGKGPAMKSIQSIQEKLREVEGYNRNQPLKERIDLIRDVIRGWRQYFELNFEMFKGMPHVILVAAICEALDVQEPELLQKLTIELWTANWSNAEIHFYMAEHFYQRKRIELAACQYVTALLCEDLTETIESNALEYLELSKNQWEKIRLHVAHHWAQIPDTNAWRALAELFAEAGVFELAQSMDARSRHKSTAVISTIDSTMSELSEEKSKTDPKNSTPTASAELNTKSRDLYLKLFRGRDGILGEEYLDQHGNKSYHKRDLPLNIETLESHLKGEHTYGLFILNPNNTVNVCLLDLDVKKRFILTRTEQGRGFEDLIDQCHAYAYELYDCAKRLGIPAIVEDSGYKGRHLWMFFDDAVVPSVARQLLFKIVSEAEDSPEAISVEYFPSRDNFKQDKLGDLIKLPLGFNLKGQRQARFVNRDNDYPDQNQALHSIRPITRSRLKTLLEKGVVSKSSLRKVVEPMKVKLSELDGLPARGPIRKVVKECELMRFFVNKAQKVNHLTHMERISLLHVFGHLGDDGKAFLHRVIAHCMNYDPQYTQAQFAKIKPSPISCPRLKETFNQVTKTIKCNCHFGSLAGNAYPSPVLWANSEFFGSRTRKSKKTKPDSNKTVATDVGLRGQENESPEIRLKAEADELVKKYINTRSNFRGVEKSIMRLENEMMDLLNTMETDSIETSFGVLRCISNDGQRPKFIIEI